MKTLSICVLGTDKYMWLSISVCCTFLMHGEFSNTDYLHYNYLHNYNKETYTMLMLAFNTHTVFLLKQDVTMKSTVIMMLEIATKYQNPISICASL